MTAKPNRSTNIRARETFTWKSIKKDESECYLRETEREERRKFQKHRKTTPLCYFAWLHRISILEASEGMLYMSKMHTNAILCLLPMRLHPFSHFSDETLSQHFSRISERPRNDEQPLLYLPCPSSAHEVSWSVIYVHALSKWVRIGSSQLHWHELRS